MPFPMHYQNSLTNFQKLLLLRCFRVDRVYRAVTDYVTLTMSEKWVALVSNVNGLCISPTQCSIFFLCIISMCSLKWMLVSVLKPSFTQQNWYFFCRAAHCASFPTRYVQPPVISFEAVFEQSSPYSPVVFILSPGCDPISDLMKLAEKTGFGGDRLKFLAMGQGQEQVTSVGRVGTFCGHWVGMWIANHAFTVMGLSKFPFWRALKMKLICALEIEYNLPN